MSHEPLTTSLLLELIDRLQVAFPRSRNGENPTQLADVYRNGLRGLSGDAVRDAVDRVIQAEEFFPKVAKIRAIATAFDRSRIVTLRRVDDGDPDKCPVCHARVTMHEIMHATGEKDIAGKPIYQPTGRTRGEMIHDRARHGISDHDIEAAG